MANPTEDNKALVLAGITGVFIDRDPTVLDRLFSDDYKQHNPQIPNGTAAIKAILKGYHRISNISPALWRPMATIAEVPSYRVRM